MQLCRSLERSTRDFDSWGLSGHIYKEIYRKMFHLSLLARFSERTFLFYVGSDSHDANCPLWNVPNESQITILQSAGPQKLRVFIKTQRSITTILFKVCSC